MNATVTTAAAATPSRALNVGLWIVQVLLAAFFFMAGFGKLAQSAEALSAQMPWVTPSLLLLVRFIGVSEVLAAVGLLLPSITRIQPRLTPLAAIGLVVVMVLAAAFHASRGEYWALPTNFVLGGLAAFIAWGRSKKAPIAAR